MRMWGIVAYLKVEGKAPEVVEHVVKRSNDSRRDESLEKGGEGI